MDEELRKELSLALQHIGGVRLLKQDEADELIEKARGAFVADPGRLWWWESVSSPCSSRTYGESDVSKILLASLREKGPQFYMVITDDQPRPWAVVSGDLDGLIKVIQGTRPFEYFLMDESIAWILFDTHHNSLIAAGDLELRSP